VSTEVLLVVPCLMFLALCTVQLAAFATAVASATHVATEAATVAAARGGSPADAMAAVNEGLANVGATPAGASRIDVDGDRITVHVSVAVPRIVPVGPLNVVRSATVMRERFIAYPER
jgi:hypothetical protein